MGGLSLKTLQLIILFGVFVCFLFFAEIGNERMTDMASRFYYSQNFSGGHSRERTKHDLSWRNLSDEELSQLSVMGRRLFLGEDLGKPQNRNFTILLMPHVNFTENRHIYRFGKVKVDPFKDCSVHNCEITYNVSAASTADAVYIHFHRTKGHHTFPVRSSPDQIWIWQTDESPVHNFWQAVDKNLAHYNGFFNWSMTFRMDSDIPVPYGRTVRLPQEDALQIDNYFDAKPKLVAAMMTNCGHSTNNRTGYIKKLQEYISVDFYGRCGKLKCPGHFRKDCKVLEQYKFYLAFENSNCRDYITEKVWWNSLEKKAVPVVMGGSKANYRKLLPPDSFIHIDDFETPKDLAQELLLLASDRESYMKYHQWRRHYKVVQEHGYFGAPIYHYCRVCEALNYNDRSPKTYQTIEKFWGKKEQCQPPTWMERLQKANANVKTLVETTKTRT